MLVWNKLNTQINENLWFLKKKRERVRFGTIDIISDKADISGKM